MRIFIPLLTIVAMGTACANQGTLASHATGAPTGRPGERPAAAIAAVASPGRTTQSVAAPNADPTVGRLINETRWRVEVFINADPDSLKTAPSMTLNPRDTRPSHLDLGPHRIIALAFVDTQFGTRMVGQYDRTVQVNPRGIGWSLRFTEGVFR
ncbi:MAG: hypothetical protein ACE5G5_05180 [Candidatus Methylomirabilales bacterium]